MERQGEVGKEKSKVGILTAELIDKNWMQRAFTRLKQSLGSCVSITSPGQTRFL